MTWKNASRSNGIIAGLTQTRPGACLSQTNEDAARLEGMSQHRQSSATVMTLLIIFSSWTAYHKATVIERT